MIKKLFIALLFLAVVMAGLLLVSIGTLDHEKLLQEFVQIAKIDSSSIKASEFVIRKSSSPHLHISQIKQADKVVVRDVNIYFSILSLLSFNPQITNISIGEMRVSSAHKSLSVINHDKFLMELLEKQVFSVKGYVDRLVFVDEEGAESLVIRKFRSTASSVGKLSFVGVIDGVGEITAAINSSGDEIFFKLAAQDDYTNLVLEESYKNKKLEGGKFFIASSRLVQRIAQLVPGVGELAQKLTSSEKIKVTLDITPTNSHIGFTNIIIDSDSISGAGELNLSKDDVNVGDINFNFAKMDLYSWQRMHGEDDVGYADGYVNNKRFDFQKNPMNINILAKNVKIGESNSISGLSIQGKVENGALNIQNFTGDIEGGGFKINGIVTQNSFRSLFEGKVVFNHKDLNDVAEYFGGKNARSKNPIPFSFSSDAKVSSVDLSLQNLLIKTQETDVMGSISTKYISNSPRTNATLKFSSVDIDQQNFPAISQIFERGMSLFDGMKKEDYLSRFIPIRKINVIGNYDITFGKLVAQQRLYENLNFNLSMSPGKIAFERLSIKNGEDWIDTSIALEAQGIKPVIHFDIHDASIAINFLSPSAMLELRKKIMDNFDPSKLDVIMKFYITKLYDGDFSLGRVWFLAKNDKNLLDIKQLDADILGGRMQSSGSVLLEPYTINFVYALNSAHVAQIAKLLPDGMLESGGVISASGMWSTRGNTLDAQLYNLYTKSNLLAKGVTIHNFSIDNFIREIGRENYDLSSFKDDTKRGLLTGETEIKNLKTSIELVKGDVTLSDLAFKTQYSAAVGNAKLNIYDFNIDASTLFSFFLSKPMHGKSYTDYAPAKMKVNINGNVFSPKKTAETTELEELLGASANRR